MEELRGPESTWRDWPDLSNKRKGNSGRKVIDRTHNINTDAEVQAACTSGGWNIQLINQPANNPDTNILDIGFFSSIQALQDRTTPRTVNDLIAEIKRAFAEQESAILGRGWTSLQAISQEMMLAKGDNTFRLSYLKKQTNKRRGTPLPRELPCSPEPWEAAQKALN